MKIPVSKPTIGEREKELVLKTMNDGWISSQSPVIAEFEKKFAEWNGYKYGVSCSSGTSAIQLAVESLHLSPGDEVIVPEFTMIATAWAVEDGGGKPVFVDCGPDLNIDVDKIERKITARTKAIVPVHIYGRQCNMDRILEIAYEYGLRVIEDSCEAHGIKPRGDIACFSLFANKIISSGEGGICVTNSEYYAEQMKHLRGMAFNYAHTFLHKKKAHNFRMTAFQAAFALGQLERVNEILEKRKQIEKWYNELLFGVLGIILMPPRDVVWMYDIECDNRDKLQRFLEENGIETRVFFRPMSQQPMYYDPAYDLTMAHRHFQRGLYLPTFLDITRTEVEFVCAKIKEFYGQKNVDRSS